MLEWVVDQPEIHVDFTAAGVQESIGHRTVKGVYNQIVEAVKLFVAHGADPNTIGAGTKRLLLIQALINMGCMEAVHWLALEAGVNVKYLIVQGTRCGALGVRKLAELQRDLYATVPVSEHPRHLCHELV